LLKKHRCRRRRHGVRRGRPPLRPMRKVRICKAFVRRFGEQVPRKILFSTPMF
jgi:hypothetical protein